MLRLDCDSDVVDLQEASYCPITDRREADHQDVEHRERVNGSITEPGAGGRVDAPERSGQNGACAVLDDDDCVMLSLRRTRDDFSDGNTLQASRFCAILSATSSRTP